MIPNKTPPQQTQHKTNALGGWGASARARRKANSDAQAGASKNEPHQEKKPSFSMLPITEGNETKHQQRAGCQDTTTQPNATMRAPSQCLSAHAIGAKKKMRENTTIKMVFLVLSRWRPSLSVCSITGCKGKMRACDAAARAPSQRLSTRAMGTKER